MCWFSCSTFQCCITFELNPFVQSAAILFQNMHSDKRAQFSRVRCRSVTHITSSINIIQMVSHLVLRMRFEVKWIIYCFFPCCKCTVNNLRAWGKFCSECLVLRNAKRLSLAIHTLCHVTLVPLQNGNSKTPDRD